MRRGEGRGGEMRRGEGRGGERRREEGRGYLQWLNVVYFSNIII